MQRYTARAHPCPEGCDTIPIDDPHYGVAPKWKPVSRGRNPRNPCSAMARRSLPRRSLPTKPRRRECKTNKVTKVGLEWSAHMGNRSTGGRTASLFVIFVPFVVQICDRTSIFVQGNEINTKEPKSTKERDLPSWYGSVSAQSAAAENEKPLRTCSPAPYSSSRPTAIRLVGAELGSIGVEKTEAIGRYLGGSPVSAVHHHTVTTIFPTCWFDSR